MDSSLRQFLVVLAGTIVAAVVVTIILDPPGATANAITFAVIMVAGVSLAYVIGYLGESWEATAYDEPVAQPRTEATEGDKVAFRGLLVEGIGVAIASMFGLLLLVLFLMEETGLLQSQGLSTGGIAGWVVLAVLALTLAAVGLWSWRSR